MKIVSTLILSMLTCITAMSQKDVYLNIKHKLGADDFAFNQLTANDLGVNLSITRIDYYLSSFSIIHDGGTETAAPAGTYILAKGSSDVSVNLGSFNLTNVEGIKFSVGVDSPTNTSDPTVWFAPHPLAPQSPSMHWGWTAGYRFVAIHGMAGENLSTEFQMHGLWDRNYFSQTIMLDGESTDSTVNLNLEADYSRALKGINVAMGQIDHGNDASDLTVLENFRDYVFAPEGSRTSVEQIADQKSSLNIFPNPSSGSFNLQSIGFDSNKSSIAVYDMSGRKVKEFAMNGLENHSLKVESKGIYILSVISEGVSVHQEKLLIQ